MPVLKDVERTALRSAPADPHAMAYRFGPFQLDPRSGVLCGPEGPIPVRRQAFRLALVLLENAPDLLDHNTLLDLAWGRSAISANALPQTISELRHALGDSARHPRFIETVHRRGYRVICPVERIEPAPAAPWTRAKSGPPGPSRPGGHLRAGAMLVAVTLMGASAPLRPTGAGAVGQAPAIATVSALPQAVLEMCALLPAHGDPQPAASDDPVPEWPAAGVTSALTATCLPSH